MSDHDTGDLQARDEAVAAERIRREVEAERVRNALALADAGRGRPMSADDDPAPRWHMPLGVGEELESAAQRVLAAGRAPAAYRWACRLVLELDEVRVERLQSISGLDIRREGLRCPAHDFESGFCIAHETAAGEDGDCAALREAFAAGWDRINGKREGGAYAWPRDPWVWVLSFRVVEAPSDE